MHFVEEGRCCGWTSAWITISVVVFLVLSDDDDILHMSKNFTNRSKWTSFFCHIKCFKDQNCSQQTRPISFLLNFTLYGFHGGKSVGNSRPLSTKSIFDQNVLLSVWKLNWNFTSTLYRFSLHFPLWTFLWTPRKRVF